MTQSVPSESAAKSYPVIYGPGTGDAHDKVKEPLGYASSEAGALRIGSQKLGRPSTTDRRVATLQEFPDLYPDLTDNAGPVTAWVVSPQLIPHRRTRTVQRSKASTATAPAATGTQLTPDSADAIPLFVLGGRETGGMLLATWTVTTPEGAKKQIIWDQSGNGVDHPALSVVSTGLDGRTYTRPLSGDAYAVTDGKTKTAQAAVERFVGELNAQILEEHGVARPEPQAQPAKAVRGVKASATAESDLVLF